MKKFLGILILTLVSFSYSFAQSANEVYVGYSFVRSDLKFSELATRFNENTDSHGFVTSYTRYLNKGKEFGVTGEFGANFDSSRSKATLVTLMGGVTIKNREAKNFNPYFKGLVGVARQEVNRTNVFNTSDVSPAFSVGGGFDVNVVKKAKWRIGADYINLGFNSSRHNAWRFHTGLVF